MLEQPDIPKETIIASLHANYGIATTRLTFLPLGADPNTAVFRADAADGAKWFVKLRSGNFLRASVMVPKALHAGGFMQVIAPITAHSGRSWANLPPYRVILSPFVEGSDGFATPLTESQRIAFGRILKTLHTSALPPDITQGVPRETFSTRWQESVSSFLQLVETQRFQEPVAAETAALLLTKKKILLKLIEHTAQLTRRACSLEAPFILCHADIHVGNLLLARDGAVFIIDWDTLKFAPVERDLMFIGAGLGGPGHLPEEEKRLFFEGYGPAEINPHLVAFYRCDRILEDIAVFCEELLLSTAGGADRAQNLSFLKSNFDPGGTIELAYHNA